MMKILITGTTGFVGSHLASFFCKDNEIYGLVRKQDKLNIPIKFIQADLLRWDELESAFLGDEALMNFDLIIHTASVVATSDNLDDLSVVSRNNVISFNIAKLSLLVSCKKFINISSSSVYPNINGIFSELSVVNPAANNDAFYGLSKLNAEVILDKILLKSGTLLTHLRCAMIYGDGVDKSRIWPTMELELKDNNTITVFAEGKRLINQIHINNLLSIINSIIKLRLAGIYNIKEETVSTMVLAERIIKEKGDERSRIIFDERGTALEFVLDCSKIEKLL